MKVNLGLVHHSWGGAAVSRLVRSTSVQGSGFEPSPGALCFLGRDVVASFYSSRDELERLVGHLTRMQI